MENTRLVSAIAKLAVAGEQAGFTVVERGRETPKLPLRILA
jgi:hypothetical protein